MVDDYDAEHTASLFKLLSIKSTISIASELTSGEKSSAAKAKLEDTKQKQIALLVSNSTSLKSACEICKGQCKTFMFICSTIRPELLKDILGMSDGCPLALWAAINNCYGNNDVALQAAQCNLRRPDIYLICPGNSIHSVWAHIQALISVLATETGRHKMLEQSRLVILVTVLKSIDPAFEAQFNTLADDSTVEVVLQALNHMEASHQATPSSDAVLFAGQHQDQHGQPTGPAPQHRQQQHQQQQQFHHHRNWNDSHSKYCLFHNSHGHSLKECHKNTCLRPSQQAPHAATLVAMTTTAITTASSMPMHTSPSTMLTAMTTATTTAHPSNFTIISKSNAHTVTPTMEATINNTSHVNYSVFSLVPTMHLPTNTDTGAMQHTTNQQDLLHDFILLTMPSHLMCANSRHIKCISHSTLHRVTIINRQESAIMMQDITYMPSTSHTLISTQQLLDAGCTIIFDQLHSFQFFLDDQLRLLSYRSGNLFYFNITFSPTPTCASLLAALSTFSPQLCMDLIHCHLGHASKAHCQESIQQSTNFSNQEKCEILSSSITPLCSICLAGKPTIHGVSHQPHKSRPPS